MLRRSQQNLTEDAKAQLAEMDTLLAENSRLKRLLREKEGELFFLSACCVTQKSAVCDLIFTCLVLRDANHLPLQFFVTKCCGIEAYDGQVCLLCAN